METKHIINKLLSSPEPSVIQVSKSIKNATEVFLKRKLFKRISTGEIIRDEFVALHYPLYWHYDILGALKVMAEAGFINDDRCSEALDLLTQKMIEDEGWPAEKSYYKVSEGGGQDLSFYIRLQCVRRPSRQPS